MKSLRINLLLWLSVAFISACGGSGSDSVAATPGDQDPAPAPVLDVSPGGIWNRESSAPVSTQTFYIAENGKLMLDYLDIDEGVLRVGSGQISSSTDTEITGSYRQWNVPLGVAVLTPDIYDCALEGTLIERDSLNLSLSCTDSSGSTEIEMVNFSTSASCPDGLVCIPSTSYETPSSLDFIAGTYSYSTLFTPSEISISSSGQVSGNFHNGVDCQVDGTVSVIDENYNLYDFEWTLSNCSPAIPGQEGAEFEGFVFMTNNSLVASSQLSFLMMRTEDLIPGFVTGAYSRVP